ncbi:hypothetical protein SDC9_139619 [bioreactor metagenome]|uniref:Uncharacterized protein n=1 Tax=bioreactor metagenome TaxID=1076179 RepID=A0A645DSM2_9ZZZZ
MVKETNRMLKATSLGVFWRLAPSTRLIMRSKKPSPGLAETFTTSQSERMRVPPVTALRSPPDSRITGADSPVTADSSTEAMPSTISPSAGKMSPASTRNRSPWRKLGEATTENWPGCTPFSERWLSFLALVSLRVLRKASAWALPRPSASASEKLANKTVNHSHRVMIPMNQGLASPLPNKDCTYRAVVSRLPISTTNMTGFLIMWRGSSLISESNAAR